jgi:hypothetical protein
MERESQQGADIVGVKAVVVSLLMWKSMAQLPVVMIQ